VDEVQRRSILLTALGAAAVQTLSTGAANAAPTDATPPPPVKILPAAIASMKAQSAVAQVTQWSALINRLKDYGSWPPTFDTPYETGAIPKLQLIAARESSQLTHNPRLVEPLLGEIASLLDRCLAYRDQGATLEIQGVAASLNRLIFDSTADLDQKLARSDPSPDVANILASNYPKAVAHFQGANNEIGNGTALQLSAQALGNAKLRDVEQSRLGLTLARLQLVQDINRQMLARYDVPGNADNYAQRFDRYRSLFESDITSAYERGYAASSGLAKLFDYNVAPPPPNDPAFLDNFVIWTRNAMRAVAKLGETEIEITRYVLISNVPASVFDFDLSGTFLGLTHVRLRSLAVSFCADAGVIGGPSPDEKKSNASFGFVMVKSNNQFGPRSVIVLPAVKGYGQQRVPDSISGAAIYNVDPAGVWSMRLSTKGVTTNNGPIDRTGLVTGLILQLHCVCVPDPANDGSWWTAEDRV
jgi:hypothetical protein